MKSTIASCVIRAVGFRRAAAVRGRGAAVPTAAVLGLSLCCCGLFLAGCGSGAYDALMTQRLAEANRAAPFTVLHGSQTLEGTRVKIRVPLVFTASYVKGSPHPQDGPAINPQRLQPPFMSLPGFRLCFEATEQDPQNLKLPYYCYLAAIAVQPGMTLEAPIAAKLKQEFPAADPAWEAATVQNPTGEQIAWKKIHVEGEQVFEAQRLGQPSESMKLPGIFELWMYESPDYIVLVGWRVPTAIEDKVHLLDLAPITAGSIAIDPPPAAAPPAAPAEAGAVPAQPPA